ncbi:MAG: urea transporter [Chitinophagales bacterium]|nr:urea transporter [Chitinophagales bacterium]MDW8273815.1 urea transporter [Chitinophagales bacterium]
MFENKTFWIKSFIKTVLHSYSQIMFSKDPVLAMLLICVTFFDWQLGISGLFGITIVYLFALAMRFSSAALQEGIYTYAPLMSCLAACSIYKLNFSMLLMLPLLAVATFLITIFFLRITDKYQLPVLSIPFLFSVWLFITSAENFGTLQLYPKEGYLTVILFIKHLTEILNKILVKFPFADFFLLFFRSLGAIFFQYNELAGVLIFIGIIYFSRIAAVLSVYGFTMGYVFYYFFQGDFTPLVYSYIGFNFILTSIAIGGFFLIPSRGSFIILLWCIPFAALLTASFHTIFSKIGLPLYSLPFNVATLLTIVMLQTRKSAKHIVLVAEQEYSPEQNHYKYFTDKARFVRHTHYRVFLPFWGKWFVSQGHNGKITHQDEWQYAWDFDLRDSFGSTCKMPGKKLEDYYCYDKPIASPGFGTVIEVVDGIPDNQIGEINTFQNWGNTIIIKHGEYLYSKLSHLRSGSIRVNKGDFVVPGQILATCGNSGRSPEPHLHFQLQATPYIGSKTLKYPISYYLNYNYDAPKLCSFDYPEENQWVGNIQRCNLLKEALNLPPGKTINILYQNKGRRIKEKWEVFTNPFNQLYIYCHSSNAIAYFVNDGLMFYFTDYVGKKNVALYHFYLAAYRVLMAYYPQITIQDRLLISDMFSTLVKNFHDLTAPFFHYCKGHYYLNYTYADNEHNPQKVTLKSICQAQIFNKTYEKKQYIIDFENGSVLRFISKDNEGICEYLWQE